MKHAPKEHYDVIVLGGGAAGMMAAGRAAECGKRVVLLEKNARLGEKLSISGGGRCNITNAEPDTRALLQRYGAAEQFLYSPFSQFGVEDTFAFFERLGLPLVVQTRKRAFPQTERATDVVRVLARYLKRGGVSVRTAARVSRVLRSGNRVTGVVADGVTYTATSYILATGGRSRPETGSTGDGFKWLSSLEHDVKQPTPTIVPLATSDAWGHALSGVSLSFMQITFFVDGQRAFSRRGKLLFTHFGLSGPLILNSAGAVGELLHDGIVTARIDTYPDTDHGALERKVLKHFDANKNKMFKNVLSDIAPRGLADAVLTLLPSIDPALPVHSVTKEQRAALVHLLKALPVSITGLMGYDRAVVADGGVALTDIDTKTMRSRVCDNLFVVGDLLHINRPSGGYSLQLCWTTGWVAGSHA